jgi:hypothetical protein
MTLTPGTGMEEDFCRVSLTFADGLFLGLSLFQGAHRAARCTISP